MLAESHIFVSASVIIMKRSYGMTTYGWQGEYGASGAKRFRSVAYTAPTKRIENSALTAPQLLAVDRRITRKTKRIIKGMAEKKYYIGSSGTQSITQAGAIVNVMGDLRRGDGVSEFDGNRVRINKATFRWTWDLTATEDETAALYGSVRFIIVQGKGDINTVVDSEVSYFLNIESAIFAQLSQWNPLTRHNFKVLYDSGPQTATTTNGFTGALGCAWSDQCTLYQKQLSPVFFGTEDNNPPNVIKNPLYLVLISDSAVSPNPIINCVWDIEFTDDI